MGILQAVFQIAYTTRQFRDFLVLWDRAEKGVRTARTRSLGIRSKRGSMPTSSWVDARTKLNKCELTEAHASSRA